MIKTLIQFGLELTISDKAVYIGIITEKRLKNRGSVSVRRKRKRGFNGGNGSYGLKMWLGKVNGTGTRDEGLMGVSTSGLLKLGMV